MGLEPTTFCMANESGSSRPFAPVRSNRLFAALPSKRANATEPERTPNLAILATASGAESGLVELLGDQLGVFCYEPVRPIERRSITPEVAGSSPVTPVKSLPIGLFLLAV